MQQEKKQYTNYSQKYMRNITEEDIAREKGVEAPEVEDYAPNFYAVDCKENIKIRLRRKPTTNSDILQRMPCKTKLILLAEVNADWAQVQLVDDSTVTGYVMREYITQLMD